MVDETANMTMVTTASSNDESMLNPEPPAELYEDRGTVLNLLQNFTNLLRKSYILTLVASYCSFTASKYCIECLLDIR